MFQAWWGNRRRCVWSILATLSFLVLYTTALTYPNDISARSEGRNTRLHAARMTIQFRIRYPCIAEGQTKM